MKNIYPWLQEKYDGLLASYRAGRMPHALLIDGPRGIGKLDLANRICSQMFEEHLNAAQTDKISQLITAGTHPDFQHLTPPEDKKSISVDQIREFSHRLSLTPQLGDIKVAIIQPAESMTMEAANALLKTLEEPSGNSYLFLITHLSARLPLTIRSRCQHITLTTPERSQASQWLESRISSQSEALLDMANGAPLLACLYHETEALSEFNRLLADLKSLQENNGQIIRIAASWKNTDLNQLISWLKQLIYFAIRQLAGNETTSRDTPSHLKSLKISWNSIDLTKAFNYQGFLDKASREVDYNLNRELFLEQIFTQWAALKTA